MQELMQIRVAQFDSLQKFLSRFHYLNSKIKAQGVIYDDTWLLSILLQGLKSYDENWIRGMQFQFRTGKLTYSEILDMVQELSNEQQSHMMAAVRTGSLDKKWYNYGNSGGGNTGDLNMRGGDSGGYNPASGDHRGSNNNNNGQQGAPCFDSRCSKTHPQPPRHPYHDFCGQHHQGAMDDCWKAHPELKKKWKKAKEEGSSKGVNPNANKSVFNYISGVMTDINKKNFNGLAINAAKFLTLIESVHFDVSKKKKMVIKEICGQSTPRSTPEDDGIMEQDRVSETVVANVVNDLKLDEDTVCLDSGASNNLFNHRKWFEGEFEELEMPIAMTAANSAISKSYFKGTVNLFCNQSDGNLTNLTILQSLYFTDTPINLLSAG